VLGWNGSPAASTTRNISASTVDLAKMESGMLDPAKKKWPRRLANPLRQGKLKFEPSVDVSAST